MAPARVAVQLAAARREVEDGRTQCLVGAGFVRDPPDATPRYSKWLNSMTPAQLQHQWLVECTVILPTWFMPREAFDRAGPFPESYVHEAEDLVFFHRHIQLGGTVVRTHPPCPTPCEHGRMMETLDLMRVANGRTGPSCPRSERQAHRC